MGHALPEGGRMKIFAIGLMGSTLLVPPQTFSPDAEGFIRNWLVLAPIVIEVSGAEAIDHRFLDDEPAIKPKPRDSVVIINTPLTWQAHQASDYFVDFLQAFPQPGEQVAAYAATYVMADTEMNVTLAVGTNDQGKAWLNGKEVFKFAETRVLEKDATRVPVTLRKGQNVLVLKIVNETNNWQACARFLKDGQPVTGLRIATAPE
jgi:hypothetical protein